MQVRDRDRAEPPARLEDCRARGKEARRAAERNAFVGAVRAGRLPALPEEGGGGSRS